MKTQEKNKYSVFRINDELRQLVKIEAAKENISMSEYIEKAVNHYKNKK